MGSILTSTDYAFNLQFLIIISEPFFIYLIQFFSIYVLANEDQIIQCLKNIHCTNMVPLYYIRTKMKTIVKVQQCIMMVNSYYATKKNNIQECPTCKLTNIY